MVAYTMPQKSKEKERSERVRGERGQIKFIDLRFERCDTLKLAPARLSRTTGSLLAWLLNFAKNYLPGSLYCSISLPICSSREQIRCLCDCDKKENTTITLNCQALH